MKIKIPNGIDREGKPTFLEIKGEIVIKDGEIFFKKKVDTETHNFDTSLANAWRAEDVAIDEELAKKEIEKRVENWDKLVEALKFYAEKHHLYDENGKQYCSIYKDEAIENPCGCYIFGEEPRPQPNFVELNDGGKVENGFEARKVLKENGL